MEVSAFKHIGTGGVSALGAGRSPLLRLQSDERLVVLIRRGHHGAFEVLVARYTARLLAFCRHMLGSREDAEDVLQEVFAAAFNALQADDRPVNVRPWLYRIARNRSLNHLRRTPAIGVDSMDVHLAEHGISTADKVHRREEFRQLIADVGTLPETQRSALLMREMDNLSYEQIAEAMETTIPSVKSLLVRARVGLAEAAEARMLTCEQVRFELGEVAEGLTKLTSPVRRHLKGCDRCASFRRQLHDTNKALAAVMPIGAVLLAKKLVLAHLGHTASGGGGAAAVGAAGGSATAGSTTGGLLSAGFGALGTKAAVGLTAAALVTAGAVEVQVATHAPRRHPLAALGAPPALRTPAPVHRLSPRALPPVASHRPAHAEHAPPPPPHRPPAAAAPQPARATPAKAPATPSQAASVKAPVTPPQPVEPHPLTPAPPTLPAPTQLLSDSTTVSSSPAEGSGSGSGDTGSTGSSGSTGSGAPAGSGGSSGSGSAAPPQGSGGGDPSAGSGSAPTPVVGAPAPVAPPLP